MHHPPPPVGSLQIAPSILSADFASLAEGIRAVAPETDRLHVDIMDGHFVPNLSIGPLVVSAARPVSDAHFDCHLMLEEPGRYLAAFAEAGADGCTVHVEVGGTDELLGEMSELGLTRGLALNPDTPADAVLAHLDDVDLVLCMTVHPGFGGQSFIGEVMDKVRVLRAEIDRRGLPVDLQVDGGISARTAPIAIEAGANVLVAGSAIFAAPDPLAAARELREAASSLHAA